MEDGGQAPKELVQNLALTALTTPYHKKADNLLYTLECNFGLSRTTVHGRSTGESKQLFNTLLNITLLELPLVTTASEELTDRLQELTDRLQELTDRLQELTDRLQELTDRLQELTDRLQELTYVLAARINWHKWPVMFLVLCSVV